MGDGEVRVGVVEVAKVGMEVEVGIEVRVGEMGEMGDG
jgi:hypothetical protein